MTFEEKKKLIGQRIKKRRKDLKLSQQDLAEMMGVHKSSIMRYEKGTIDNTKVLVLQGFSAALHVTPEWLRGETDMIETEESDQTDKQIVEKFQDLIKHFPLNLPLEDDMFARNILLCLLEEYIRFTNSFTYACANFSEANDNSKIAEMIGFESASRYNELQFLNEVMPMIDTLTACSDALRLYGKDPEKARADVYSLKTHLLPETEEPCETDQTDI